MACKIILLPIYDDYFYDVALLFLQKISATDAENMYRDLSSKIFRMNNLLGLGTLFLTQSFYDSSLLEKQIRKHPVTEKLFIETSADRDVPRVGHTDFCASGFFAPISGTLSS